MTHPIYDRLRWWWSFYHLSYVGGRDYLRPQITQDWWLPAVLPGGDQASGGDNRALTWQRGELRSFLFRHDREENGPYEQRIARSYYRNMTRPVVDTYAAHVLSQSIERDFANAPRLEDVRADVDLRDSDATEWMMDGLRWAQVFGHVFAVVDMPRVLPGEILTRADEQSAGIRPYASWYSPLHVLDWEVDRYGRFLWVRLLEADTRAARPDANLMTAAAGGGDGLHRVWYADRWELYEARSTTADAQPQPGRMIDSGPNPLGRVPVEVLYGQRVPGEIGPVGQSRIADIAFVNREIYNLDSLKQDMIYNQAFAFCAIPDKSGKVSRIDVGTRRAFVYDPEGGGVPQFVGPPVEYVTNLRDEIADLVLQIRSMAGLSRGVSEQSIAARSGDALMVETQDKAAMLMSLAHEAEDFETRFWRLAAAWLGVGDWAGHVRYPASYNVQTLGDALSEALDYAKLSPPPRANAMVLEGVTRRMLPNLPEATLRPVIDEIRESAEEPEPTTPPAAPEVEAASEGEEIEE